MTTPYREPGPKPPDDGPLAPVVVPQARPRRRHVPSAFSYVMIGAFIMLFAALVQSAFSLHPGR